MDLQQYELEHEQRLANARAHAATLTLDEIDVAHWDLMRFDTIWPYFERLRREAPVFHHERSIVGPYWSVTSYDLVKAVDIDAARFSSEPTIGLYTPEAPDQANSFIAMDDPKHAEQRKTVAPVAGPRNLAALAPTIRQRVAAILDSLPVGEPFNWVERVSIELTTQMLATLFDFPFAERHKLTRWSDIATSPRKAGYWNTMQERDAALNECLVRMTELRDERINQPPAHDLLSMLAHGASTRDMPPREFLGNLLLLIVGGNDTTRNSISGGVLAMNRWPGEFEKLKADRSKIPNAVAEIIRWQTPLAFMRRTTTEDVEIGGTVIPQGERVLMWYASGNRDAEVFENLWEELLDRYSQIEVVGAPVRAISNFVRGYTQLPVVLHI